MHGIEGMPKPKFEVVTVTSKIGSEPNKKAALFPDKTTKINSATDIPPTCLFQKDGIWHAKVFYNNEGEYAKVKVDSLRNNDE